MTSRSKKYNYNINASGNFATNNLNLGVSNMFSGSFSASNNVESPTNVTGLSFDNASVRFFQCQMTVNITRSSGGNLSELFTLEGHQIDSGWNLYMTSISDTTGVEFSITSSGQVQYTSTNVDNFVTSIFRYNVTQISNTGTYSNLSTGTQGTYILNSLQLTNTEGSVLTSNPGALYVMGGGTFEKMITIKTTDNATGFGTGGGLSIFGGAAISKDVIINGNVGIGKSNPTTRLDVNGSMSLNGDLFVTGTLTSVNITTTNVVDTNISTGTLTGTNITATNVTIANAQITNSNVTSQTVSTARITANLLALGNSNTVGNIFTTGGNVGIGTTSPTALLEVNGTGRFTGSGGGTNGSLLVTGMDIYGHTFCIGGAAAHKRLVFNHSGTIGNIFSYDYGSGVAQNLQLQGPGGNVGIGTTSPISKLDVRDTSTVQINLQAGSVQTKIWSNSDNNTYFQTSGDVVFTAIDSATLRTICLRTGGNVGIGIGTPQVKLDVAGSIGIYYGSAIHVAPGSNWPSGTTKLIESGWEINGMGGDCTSIYTPGASNGTARINISSSGRINFDGNVGIGTKSPGAKLEIADGTGDGTKYGTLQITQDNASIIATANNVAQISFIRSGSYVHGLGYLRNSNTFGFGAGQVANVATFAPNYLAIKTDGNIGIGTTDPTNRLQVGGTIRATGSNTPSSGVGLEMFWENSITTSYLISYNRNTSAYQPLVISGAPIYIENCTTYMSQTLNSTDPNIALYGRPVGAGGSPDNTQQPMIRLFRNGTGGVQNGVSANILFGANTASIDGISNIQFQLTSFPGGGNNWGGTPDTTVMTLVGNGNVGIGTTAPGSRLNVNGNVTIDNGLLTVQNNSGYGNIELKGATGSHIDFGPDSTDYQSRIIHTTSDKRLEFLVNGGTVAMNFNSSGYAHFPRFQTTFGTNTVFGIEDQTTFTRLVFDKLRFWDKQYGDIAEFDSAGTTLWSPLLVSSNIGTENGYFEGLNESNNITANTEWTLIRSRNGAGIWGLKGSSNNQGSLIFKTHTTYNTPVERMRITDGGNVGIGLTPQAKLDVAGDIGLYYGSAIRVGAGSSWPNGTTKLMETGWDINGMSGDAVSIYTPGSVNGTARINLASSGVINFDGNVGIGTKSPSNKLEVNGGRIRVDDTNNAVLELKTNSNISYIFTENTGSLKIYPGSTSHHVLLQPGGGNVGIGIDGNPAGRLNVVESTGTAAGANAGSIIIDHENNGGASSITFRSKANRGSDYGFIQYQDASSVGGGGEAARLILGTQNDADDHVVLLPSGGVGIGNNSPGSLLMVGNAINDQAGSKATISLFGANSTPQTSSYPGIYHRSGVGLGVYSDYHISFQVNGSSSLSDAMRITHTGYVGIGTGSPNYPLSVIGSVYTGYDPNFFMNGPGVVDPGYQVGYFSAYFSNAIQAAEIWGNSDIRLKTNIQDISDPNSLTILRQLQPKTFSFIDQTRSDGSLPVTYGFIAQEVETVLPDAVTRSQDFIPNIMETCSAVVIADVGTQITTVTKTIPETWSVGTVVRILDQNSSVKPVTVKSIDSPNTFTVEETLSDQQYYVYGERVDDLRVLHKEVIYAITTAAVQEIDRQLQQERERGDNLENQLITLQQQYQELLTRIINLETNN